MSRHSVILSISIALPQATHFLFFILLAFKPLINKMPKIFSLYLVYNTFTKIYLWNTSWEKQNPTGEKLSSSNNSLMIIIFSIRSNTLWIKLGLILLNSKFTSLEHPFLLKFPMLCFIALLQELMSEIWSWLRNNLQISFIFISLFN